MEPIVSPREEKGKRARGSIPLATWLAGSSFLEAALFVTLAVTFLDLPAASVTLPFETATFSALVRAAFAVLTKCATGLLER